VTSTGSSDGAAHLKESVAAFFTDYCRAFEAMNADGLTTFFSYPVLLTNAEGDQRVLGSPADYVSGIAPLLGSYRELGVESGKVLDLDVVPLAPTLAVAVVDWEVIGRDRRPLYGHRASYTLVRKDAWQIAAIAVNELPKLREALRAHIQRREGEKSMATGSAVPDRRLNVLFLSADNTARSIIAEAILNRSGLGRFQAYSAGPHPKAEINEDAAAVLKRLNYLTEGLRPKPCEEFLGTGTPRMDFVFSLCDEVDAEAVAWPGQPLCAQWGLPNPAATDGSAAALGLAFADCFRMLNNRIDLFLNLPHDSLDKLAMQERLKEIGRTQV
jgi:protein-tyrosine-phosphatase